MSITAVNVGPYPVANIDATLSLLKRAGARGVRYMNWLRAYEYGGAWMTSEHHDWQYAGGAWSAWRWHVPLTVCLRVQAQIGGIPYFNLPYAIVPAAMQHALLEIERAGVDRYYVTLGNEVWNTAYGAQHAYYRQLGAGNWIAGYATRLAQLSQMMPFDCGGMVVAEAQTTNAATAAELVRTFPQLDALAIAPYFGRGTVSPDTQIGRLWTETVRDLRGPITDGIERHAAIAEDASVPLVAYEAGHHWRGDAPALIELVTGGGMGHFYRELAAIWTRASGSSVYWYRLTGDGDGEHWGLYRNGQPYIKI